MNEEIQNADLTEDETPVLDSAQVPPTADLAIVREGGWHYCMNETHPGAPSYSNEPLNVTRLFQSDNPELPICPACGTAGNAIPAAGPDIPPEYIQEQQQRFGR